MSLNPQLTDMTAGQSQKEVTANGNFNILDRALNDVVVVSGVSGDISLTAAQSWENGLVQLDGTPGAAFNVDMPDANARRFAVYNNTDAVATVRNSAGGGTTADVAIGQAKILHYDGTDIRELGSVEAQAEQVEHFEPGTPSTTTTIYKKVAARAFEFEDDFAGSEAHAGTAPSSATDFDVQVNGASIGTISFASSATTATFSTSGSGTEAVSVGDRVEIITPANLNGMADISFNLAATRT